MKKWIWVLALPYVIWTSSYQIAGPRWQLCQRKIVETSELINCVSDSEEVYDCGGKAFCLDLAEALNAANRRTKR